MHGRENARIRTTLLALAAVVAAMAMPSSAFADFGLDNLTAAPADTQAGAHSSFDIHLDLTGAEDIKDLTIGLPPGMVGDPTATPRCTVTQLNADACPANTEVGDVSSSVSVLGLVR